MNKNRSRNQAELLSRPSGHEGTNGFEIGSKRCPGGGEGDPTTKLVLQDALDMAEQGPIGPDSTFHGFGAKLHPGRRIDYIFLGSRGRVLSHAILPDHFEGRPPSDHLPVLAEIVLPPAL